MRHEHGQFARARAVAVIEENIQRDRAAHTVAGHALDADDCRQLLAMLGLDTARAADQFAADALARERYA